MMGRRRRGGEGHSFILLLTARIIPSLSLITAITTGNEQQEILSPLLHHPRTTTALAMV